MASFLDYIRYYATEATAPGLGELQTKKGRVKPKSLAFTQNTGARAEFEEAPFDWEQIEKAMNTDSFLLQAFLKYRELMWKEGYYLRGVDPEAVLYVKKRLKLAGLAQGRPMDTLLADLSDSLVRFNNAFVVKARDEKPLQLAGLQAQPALGNKPVAGYFLMPVKTVKIKMDKNGRILGYRQEISGNRVDFKPEDVIHFAYDRQPGSAWGTPFILTVLEDIRSLRYMEEDMLNVFHKEVNPLYKYQIGDDAFAIEQEDIDAAKSEVADMRDDGVIVMPGTDDLDVVQIGGKNLEVGPFISYFRQRVLSGLGLSPHHLGITGDNNKSSSESSDAALYDKLKSYQTEIENILSDQMFFELLLEGGYVPFSANEDDQSVRFEFKEIDLESRVKLENHISVLWLQNMIKHGQMREMLGFDVDTEYVEEYHKDMVEFPLAELSKAIGPGGENPQSPAKGTAGSKNNPANKTGSRGAPKLAAAWDALEKEINWAIRDRDEIRVIETINSFYLSLASVTPRESMPTLTSAIADMRALAIVGNHDFSSVRNRLESLYTKSQ